MMVVESKRPPDRDELRHHFFQYPRASDVADDDGAHRNERLQFASIVSIVVTRLCRRNLSAAIQFALDGVADGALVVRCGIVSTATVVRRRLDGAHVTRAGERE